MQVKDIIIIGAGAGGLFAGLNLPNCKALITEKMSSPGKKLLMAGSGKCNITHEGNIRDFVSKYGNKSKFIKPALLEYPNSKLLDLLHINGLPTIIDENGKIFPKSENSKDVLDLFLALNRKAGTTIVYNQEVIGISNKDKLFTITTKSQQYQAKYIIIATGGSSYPLSGSDGKAYSLAKSLGHSIVSPSPALTAVIPEHYRFATVSGVALRNADISLYRNGKKINQNNGDVAFTHKSLSGPGIIDFSRYIQPGDTLAINLIEISEHTLREKIISDSTANGRKTLKNYLKQFHIPESVLILILDLNKIDGSKNLSELSRDTRNKLIELLTAYKFTVAKKVGFHQAMVTAGGVCTEEINPKTLESKLVDNLFFAGEYIDIDGDTGGYNLQAAFSTAYLACKTIRKRLDKE